MLFGRAQRGKPSIASIEFVSSFCSSCPFLSFHLHGFLSHVPIDTERNAQNVTEGLSKGYCQLEPFETNLGGREKRSSKFSGNRRGAPDRERSTPQQPMIRRSESVRSFISTTAQMSSALGPFGPGLALCFGIKSNRYLHLTKC